jgi:hypothetical protein
MKNLRLLPLVVAIALSTFSALAADNVPALSIDQALKIAQDHLQKGGADRAVIGLTLEQATFHSSYWYAKWSSPIDDGPKKEIGLRIDMDGTVTRFVTGPGGGHEPPVGQRPVGARSMR